MTEQFSTFAGFLDFLTTPDGVQATVAVALSFLAEYVPAFQKLSSLGKRWLVLGLTFGVPLLATATRHLSTGNTDWWAAFRAAGQLFIASQLGHTLIKTGAALRAKRARAKRN